MVQAQLQSAIEKALATLGVEDAEVHLERPRDASHGDVATNVAMTLASRLKRAPRDIAEELAGALELEGTGVASVEVAGPGFLNFRFAPEAYAVVLRTALQEDREYGASREGDGRPVMVEFVSANPTGPLHLGHGRQAALGDAVASLLEWTGWSVHREFYYNDAGGQIERLTDSVLARYLQALGRDVPFPEDGYHGDYVVELGQRLAQEVGDRHAEDGPQEREAIRRFAVQALREEQDRDLHAFRVHFDRYYLESSLHDEGRVDETVERLREAGLVYERDGALWLETTRFGDQKDRVMLKSDGAATYFLPDVAYHLTKWERGFQDAINIQGSDHHGTVARVRAGLRGLGLPEGYPEYVLHQMVTVEQGGEEVKFSKRAGSYTTLRELVDAVGVDVTRYFFLMRKPEAHLVFDLDAALDQSEKNPVYKAQYAHARMCSIFAKAERSLEDLDLEGAPLHRLGEPQEREIVNAVAQFPELVTGAARGRAPHLVCDYLEQTAGLVNSWYHAGNPTRNPELAVLVDDPELREARLVLAGAIRVILRNALHLLGVDAPERMLREEEAPPADPAVPG